MNIQFGIDLGGTKTEILALDSGGQNILCKRVNTPKNNYQATLECIKQLVVDAEQELSIEGTVGICTPGSVSPSSCLLRNSNSTCLNNQPFKQDLENLLNREIRISNDANCFALSEATDGAAINAKIVFGVIIGTGCGAGIIINKQIINGPNSIAGEWGHNPLPWPNAEEADAPKCWCGKSGCIETYISGTGFCNDFFRLSNFSKSSEEIVSNAKTGDELSQLALTRYERRLAKSLAHVINILDPDTIVLGGGMSNIESLYKNVPNLWNEYVFSDNVLTQLVAPIHGDSSGVRGAARLWNPE